jgi:hypothetical protein
MAANEKNKDAKDRIAEGMAEAGKHPEPGSGSGKPGGTGGPQKSGRTDEVAEGMSEAGKRPTDPVEDQAERQPS